MRLHSSRTRAGVSWDSLEVCWPMLDWQSIIVLLIIIAALIYALLRARLRLRSFCPEASGVGNPSCAAGCDGCSVSKAEIRRR